MLLNEKLVFRKQYWKHNVKEGSPGGGWGAAFKLLLLCAPVNFSRWCVSRMINFDVAPLGKVFVWELYYWRVYDIFIVQYLQDFPLDSTKQHWVALKFGWRFYLPFTSKFPMWKEPLLPWNCFKGEFYGI